MDVEYPYLTSSESSEYDTLLFEKIKKEYDTALESTRDLLSLYSDEEGDDDSSGSGSGSDECVEMEAEEIAQSKAFLHHLSFNPCITQHELKNLLTAPQATKRKKNKEIISVTQTGPSEKISPPLLVTSEEDRIILDDRDRTLLRIENDDAYVDVMIENYVYVSYFCNRNDGSRYRLALRELAIRILGYGIQYSKNKFTKLTIKYLNGPSHYFFGSGVLVESGTYSDAIAYKTHHHSMRILKEYCHYDSICVKKRKCQNIVAKGTLPFGLCLVLLKHKYPGLVHYNCEDFAGAIIRPGNMDDEMHDKGSKRRHRVNRKSTKTITEGYDAYSDDEDEDGEDEEDDESSSFTKTTSSSGKSEGDDSSSSYEYFSKSEYAGKTCHPDFDYNMIDKEERRRNEALLQKIEDESLYRVLEKKPLRQKELLQMHNAADLDDYQVTALTRKKKVTILAFLKGCIICAGSKEDKEVKKVYSKVLPMLYSCRDSDENKAAEAELIRKGLY